MAGLAHPRPLSPPEVTEASFEGRIETFLSVSLLMGIAMVAATARDLLLPPDRISSAGLSEYVHSSAISACTGHRPMFG